MNNQLTYDSIVVGMDVHKYAHTACAMNILGHEISQLEFDNDQLDSCISWLNSLGKRSDIIVGLEDIHGHGFSLSRSLSKSGFNLRFVQPVLTKRERVHSVHREKSDYLDAKRVGKVILNKIEETLPADPIVADDQKSIRLIDLHLQERSGLVKEQTAVKNRLHVLLHQHYGNDYRKDFSDIFSVKALNWYKRSLSHSESRLNKLGNKSRDEHLSYLSESIIRLIKRLSMTVSQIKDIERILNDLAKQRKDTRILKESIHGCGYLTACKVMAEIKTIKRFKTESELARYGGFAPVRSESAGKRRYHTDKHGNRKLNRAVHTIAISQIGKASLPEAEVYYRKKISEGKSKLWAIRCLKRKIVKYIFFLLTENHC